MNAKQKVKNETKKGRQCDDRVLHLLVVKMPRRNTQQNSMGRHRGRGRRSPRPSKREQNFLHKGPAFRQFLGPGNEGGTGIRPPSHKTRENEPLPVIETSLWNKFVEKRWKMDAGRWGTLVPGCQKLSLQPLPSPGFGGGRGENRWKGTRRREGARKTV